MENSKLAVTCALLFAAQAGAAEWRTHDADRSGTRFQPDETQLGTGNVGSLALEQTFQADGAIIKTPAVTEDAIYFTSYRVEFTTDIGGPADIGHDTATPDGQMIPGSYYTSHVYRLDKQFNLVWKRHINDVFAECRPGAPVPPLIIQTSATVVRDLVIVATSQINASSIVPTDLPSGYAFALDKQTGRCRWATLVTPEPAPTVVTPPGGGPPQTFHHVYEGVQASPVVDGDYLYLSTTSAEEEASAYIPNYPCCKTNGKVAKLEIGTGRIVWSTPMIAPGLAAEGYAGVTGFASPSVVIDHKNGLLITATGDAYRRGPTDPSTISAMDLPIDSLVALDLQTGAKRWVRQAVPNDFWNFACIVFAPGVGNPQNCPSPPGVNFNLEGGPVLMKNVDTGAGGRLDIVAAKVKDGNVLAVDASNGAQLWKTKIGNPVLVGVSGLSYDGQRLYATTENSPHIDFSTGQLTPRAWMLQGGPNSGATTFGGNVTALVPATGAFTWQANARTELGLPTPAVPPPVAPIVPLLFPIDPYFGPPSTANGLVFAQSLYPNTAINKFLLGFDLGIPPGPNMHVFNAATGARLWSYTSDQPVMSGAAIVDGKAYWGTGFIEERGKLYRFGLPQ